LKVEGGISIGFVRTDGDKWHELVSGDVPASPDFREGLAVASHDEIALTAASFRLGDSKPSPAAAKSIARNGSFDETGDSPDVAAQWNTWGPFKRRTSDGATVMETEAGRFAGTWQDVGVKPGARCRFELRAKISGDATDTIELRLETPRDGQQITLNSASFRVADLTRIEGWSRLSISSTALDSNVRVLAIYHPVGDHGGFSLKVDDVSVVTSE
jgi:hypothetical protein